MHPHHHAISSSRLWGGKPEDYTAIHDWFDASKEQLADFRHRALRHHSQGIFEAERVFGRTITNSEGKEVPVRFIGEQHVKEDCAGRIPTVSDWFRNIKAEPWMNRGYKLEPAPAEPTHEIVDFGKGPHDTTVDYPFAGSFEECKTWLEQHQAFQVGGNYRFGIQEIPLEVE